MQFPDKHRTPDRAFARKLLVHLYTCANLLSTLWRQLDICVLWCRSLMLAYIYEVRVYNWCNELMRMTLGHGKPRQWRHRWGHRTQLSVRLVVEILVITFFVTNQTHRMYMYMHMYIHEHTCTYMYIHEQYMHNCTCIVALMTTIHCVFWTKPEPVAKAQGLLLTVQPSKSDSQLRHFTHRLCFITFPLFYMSLSRVQSMTKNVHHDNQLMIAIKRLGFQTSRQ